MPARFGEQRQGKSDSYVDAGKRKDTGPLGVVDANKPSAMTSRLGNANTIPDCFALHKLTDRAISATIRLVMNSSEADDQL